ncbi:MAG: hypothetical protein GY773_07975 [Actinomycetia bacterium]|nr:hypothetical protein [Actinomycetes bacterium]
MSTTGVIALARPTFDVDLAEDVAAAAVSVLDEVAPGWIGSRNLLFDAATTEAAITSFRDAELDALIVLQVTFTDATMTKTLAAAVDAPLVFWAFPEERTGGRLRLNSLCGTNLAAFALGQAGRSLGYLYRAPDDPMVGVEIRSLLNVGIASPPVESTQLEIEITDEARHSAQRVASVLASSTTGVIGEHPDGFDPCRYEADTVRELTGVTIQRVELDDLFSAAEAAPVDDVEAAKFRASRALGSLDELDQQSLDHSLRIYCGLRELATDNGWTGFATRCWPECFTVYGAAACAPQAMLTDDGIPGGCEADAYGTLTSVVLRELANEPPFIADLVDVDANDDTAVFWHCGVAPLHMADPTVAAGPTVHSNRRKPLLHEFPLKPGRVTIARLSQSGGSHRLVIGGGEMLRAPLAYGGTAGVVRFDRSAESVLNTIMTEGLEHHYGIVYGDHRIELRALAEIWQLPIVDLGC